MLQACKHQIVVIDVIYVIDYCNYRTFTNFILPKKSHFYHSGCFIEKWCTNIDKSSLQTNIAKN